MDFYCNKRFDISFSDFHKLIKLCLPTDYTSRETRGIFKQDYMPCNIIAIKQSIDNTKEDFDKELNIYCWLGQKGLTVLAKDDLTVSLCSEVLRQVKQNPEDYKVLSYELLDEQKLIDSLKDSYLVYKQLNCSKDCSKYVIKEYNGDEVQIDFYFSPDSLRLSGGLSSLYTYTQLSIQKMLNKSE